MTGKKKAVLSRKGNVTRGRGNSRQIYGFLVWRGGSDPSSRFTSEEGGWTNKILPRAWLPDLGSPDKTSMLEIYSIRPSRPLREVIQSKHLHHQYKKCLNDGILGRMRQTVTVWSHSGLPGTIRNTPGRSWRPNSRRNVSAWSISAKAAGRDTTQLFIPAASRGGRTHSTGPHSGWSKRRKTL
jgi:hypothetical protein